MSISVSNLKVAQVSVDNLTASGTGFLYCSSGAIGYSQAGTFESLYISGSLTVVGQSGYLVANSSGQVSSTDASGILEYLVTSTGATQVLVSNSGVIGLTSTIPYTLMNTSTTGVALASFVQDGTLGSSLVASSYVFSSSGDNSVLMYSTTQGFVQTSMTETLKPTVDLSNVTVSNTSSVSGVLYVSSSSSTGTITSLDQVIASATSITLDPTKITMEVQGGTTGTSYIATYTPTTGTTSSMYMETLDSVIQSALNSGSVTLAISNISGFSVASTSDTTSYQQLYYNTTTKKFALLSS